MTKILLLGAGFSKNWGGLLADEVTEYLVQKLQSNPIIQKKLYNSKGFEDTYQDLLDEFVKSPTPENKSNFEAISVPVREIFSIMNKSFLKISNFNFSQDAKKSIQNFLSRFDAIFTLNQDLLLEMHYMGNQFPLGGKQWDGAQLIGMYPKGDWRSNPLETLWMPTDFHSQIQQHRFQPIYKLHGSVNWVGENGVDSTMIIGKDKFNQIGNSHVLRFLNGQFFNIFHQKEVKLMMIGYGFGDDHINSMITSAYDNKPFEIHCINPDGKNSFLRVNNTANTGIYVPQAIEQIPIIWHTRNMSSIFDNDEIGFDKLNEFFN
jgi:SIR2-like domain